MLLRCFFAKLSTIGIILPDECKIIAEYVYHMMNKL